MRKALATITTVLCLKLIAFGADGPPLKVYVALKGETLRRTGDIKYVVLANVGEKDIEVATANLSPTVRETGDAATLILSLWPPKLWKEHRVVPSRHKLLPTLLRPGQAVFCELPIGEIAKTLDVLLDTAKELKVMYKVSDYAGEQFSVWSGAVRSQGYAVGKK